jgi:hypothetical protein
MYRSTVLFGGEWSSSLPGRFTPGERAPGTHWMGGWLGPRAGLYDMEKRKFLTLPGLELRPLGRPAVASRYTDCAIFLEVVRTCCEWQKHNLK